MNEDELQKGALNLLVNCGGLSAGDKLLVLHEDPELGFYDQEIADTVMRAADDLDIEATLEVAAFSPKVADPDAALLARMKAADRTLFLARLGDQIRFRPSMSDIRPIVCYALDHHMLGSSFGTIDHKAFIMIKDALNEQLARAKNIQVTCPLGTDFSGPCAVYPVEGADVTVARFPLSVFTPAPAGNFAGKIVQNGFLVGTGSQYYQPYGRRLNGLLEVLFEGNRITGFNGEAEDVRAAEEHYQHVGRLYDIDPYFVHSWHAGIHPGCSYDRPAGANFERWSGGAFGNPRLLHFHTCGAYAPGEISLNLLDPTIKIDGVAVWESGRFHLERLGDGERILGQYPELSALFANPAQMCGQSADGSLSFD